MSKRNRDLIVTLLALGVPSPIVTNLLLGLIAAEYVLWLAQQVREKETPPTKKSKKKEAA